MLAGCLAVQAPHNPMQEAVGAAQVSSADVAPVENSAPAQLNPIELLKTLFLTRKNINDQILRMAKGLSDSELTEFNLWLRQHGVQLRRSPSTSPDQGDENKVY